MALFVATYVNRVDKKGRVSVPAPFRTALEGQAFKGVVLFRSFTAQAVEGCGHDFLDALAENSSAGLDLFSSEQDDVARMIFGDSAPLAWDPEGRILLPQDLMDFAGITEQAAFVGMGRKFQIWEPEAWKVRLAESRARAAANPPQYPARKPGS